MNFETIPPHQTPPAAPGRDLLLYVHIPFCESLCSFCTFHRVRHRKNRVGRYFAALRTEICRYADLGFRFGDVYVGGGTPTIEPQELIRTLELIRSYGVSGRISAETNPNHLKSERMEALIAAGVSRLSVGVQSFDDTLLKALGRYYPYGDGATIADRLAHTQGNFETLNIDLIFNIPGQTRESIGRDIALLHELGIDQASFYPLMPANSQGRVDYAKEKAFYLEIVDRLLPQYQRSTAWCFSRDASMIDEYIVDHDDYLGVGSGAFSFVDGTMYSTSFSINRYIDRVEKGATGIVTRRTFARQERLRYTLLVGLFGLAMPRSRLRQLHGSGATRALWRELTFFRSIGAIRSERNQYRLTERGIYLWLVMMREFLMGVNQVREQMRHHIRQESKAPVPSTAGRTPAERATG